MAAAALLVRGAVEEAQESSLYQIANGQCGEVRLDERLVKLLVGTVERLQVGTCKEQGYSIPNGKQEEQLLGMDISLALYKKEKVIDFAKVFSFGKRLFGAATGKPAPTPEPISKDAVALYKVLDTETGQCGEAVLSKQNAVMAKAMMGLEEGTCSAHGYTVEQGSKDVEIPGIGNVRLALYKRDGALGVTDVVSFVMSGDQVALCKVSGYVCSEAHIDQKFVEAVGSFSGFKVCSCEKEGYPDKVGTQALVLPLVGEVELTLYHQSVGDVTV